MRAETHSRRARMAAAALALAAMFLASTTAHADEPGALRREIGDLRTAGDTLAAREPAALLELYAIESRLAHAEDRATELRVRAARVDRAQATARRLLGAARRAHDEAQRRLGARLRSLYVEGEVDPLAIILGSASLDDAISALDSLDRIARQDNLIVDRARRARLRLRGSLSALSRREAELRHATAESEKALAALETAAFERRSVIDRLAAERQLNEDEIASLTARAEAAEARSEELTSAPTPAPAGSGAQPSQEASPPAGNSAPKATSGAELTVVATAYALPGTTATGLPVGPGVVAVDPSVIPFGTRMLIPGYGEGVAADTGGSITGNRIDVWVPTERDAHQWGWKTIVITIL